MTLADDNNNNLSSRKCSVCDRSTSHKEKTKWGIYEHWYGNHEYPVCKRCYVRANYIKKHVPVAVECDSCGTIETAKTKYGTSRWAKNSDRKGGYLCWSCYTTKNNKSRIISQEIKDNIRAGILSARDAGVVFGRRLYTINESVFDVITEESAYWIGFLMADGYICKEKTGNPRIALTLAKADYEHLVKFSNFLNSSYNILTKRTKLNGKTVLQYTLRFSSKHIAEVLMKFGVVARKTLIAKVIGLQQDRHFWRGVVDGDGWIGNRDGIDGDKMIVIGSYNLLCQFRDFIRRHIPGSSVTLKQEANYWRLFVYSYTAIMLAELLYDNSSISLNRKLEEARRMLAIM